MKHISRVQRDRRGKELGHLVPEMLEYVGGYLVPAAMPSSGIPLREGEIADMKAFAREAVRDMAMYDSPALEKTYHAWEKENAQYKSFSSEVVRMVKERFRKPPDFYRAAGIDKRTYHKMATDYGYSPSRITALRCCVGLGLSAGEAEDLLRLAGMAFSPSDPDDLIIRFCLEKGIRDIPGINYMLYRYATRTLGKAENTE